MTDGRKATVVLNYLEDCEPRKILNLLDPYLSDETLANLYDWLKNDGYDLPDEDDEEDEDYKFCGALKLRKVLLTNTYNYVLRNKLYVCFIIRMEQTHEGSKKVFLQKTCEENQERDSLAL